MMRSKILFLFYFLSPFWLYCQSNLPDDFIAEVLPVEIKNPIGIEFDNRGYGFLWEKEGKVWVIDPNQQKLPQPLIDISEEVTSFGDHGLVGFALGPAFLSTGHYYLFYTVDRHHLMHYGTSTYDPQKTISSEATISRITRFTADPSTNFTSTIDNSRKVVLGKSTADGLPILMTSHATGSIVFGNDGSLLVSFGDGGSFKQDDLGNANDTYHIQAIADDIIHPDQNVGSYRAMQLNSPNGKILRIHPETGEGYPSNPFFDPTDSGSAKSRIWALGFRNPYKFSHIPFTGSHRIEDGDPGIFLVGDVGSSQWEEINLIQEPGLWYGWPYFEGYTGKWGFWNKKVQNPEAPNPLSGNDCPEYFFFDKLYKNTSESEEYSFSNPCNKRDTIPEDIKTYIHQPPILAYSSNQWNPPAKTYIRGFDNEGILMGRSINEENSGVDGYLLEGSSILPADYNLYGLFPEEYENNLFLGDFAGWISAVELDENYQVKKIKPFLKETKGVTDLSFNPATGELFYIHILENRLVRVSFGGVLPPKVVIDADVTHGPSPLKVTLNAGNSIAYDGSVLNYSWDLGDGHTSNSESVQHTFVSDDIQSFVVTLTVVDSTGQESSDDVLISINNTPPEVDITSIPENATYSVEAFNTVRLEASVNDMEYDNQDLMYEWTVDLYHDEHFHPGPIDTRKRTYAILDPVGCDLEQYWYKIKLKVTDPAGLWTEDIVDIYPYCGDPIAEVFDLEAVREKGDILLTWNTNFDQDITHFEIEKTENNFFLPQGKVDQDGSSDYSYIDKIPYVNYNKYRIKAIHADGHYTYSNEVEIFNDYDPAFYTFPNPTNDQVNISFKNPYTDNTELRLFDATGSLLKVIPIDDPNPIIRFKIDLSPYQEGIFILQYTSDTHGFLTKLIKL